MKYCQEVLQFPKKEPYAESKKINQWLMQKLIQKSTISEFNCNNETNLFDPGKPLGEIKSKIYTRNFKVMTILLIYSSSRKINDYFMKNRWI